MKRACIYIDGFNLYYGIRSSGWTQYLWLDLERLARSFIDPRAETLARVSRPARWQRARFGV